MKSSVKNGAILTVVIAVGVMLIWKQETVSAAVIEAVKNCVYRIIPSLFAMTVISTAISNSGIIPSLLRKVPVNANIFTAFIFGNIGGYPIGAKLLSEMSADGRITKRDAESAITFCYASGPAFAAGVAGAAIFGDIRYGLAALLANILANLTLYIIFLIKNKNSSSATTLQPTGFTTKLMIDSVSSATSAMTGICSMIVFFSALKAIVESFLPVIAHLKYFSSILEISNIASLDSQKNVTLPAVAMLLGFGGLCVQIQVIAIVNGAFSLKKFYLSRFITLPLSGAYAYLFGRLLYSFGTVTAATKIRLSQSSSLIPIICVAAMVFITLKERGKVNR